MNTKKSGPDSSSVQRRKGRRAVIQWFAIALLIALVVFGTFLYLIAQENGTSDEPGGGHSGLPATDVAPLVR